MGFQCIAAPVAILQNNGTYHYNDGDYFYDKSVAMIATQACAILAMIISGPLYLAIILLFCVTFSHKRSIFKVLMILSFVVAFLLLFMLVR